MPDEYLNEVMVTFEKAFKGDQAKKHKTGTGKNGEWILWEYQASFKDETGQTKTHTTRSFARPGPVGSTQVGDLKLYRGSFEGDPYVSYTFYPQEDSQPTEPEKTEPGNTEPEKTEKPAPQASESLETQRVAIRRYVNFLWSVCTDNGSRTDEVAAAIFPGVRMIVGDFTKIYAQELANTTAEDAGMPPDDDIPF